MAWFEGVKLSYKTHRQWQIANGLNALQDRGLLSWRFVPTVPTVDYFITMPGESERVLKTKEAECFLQPMMNHERVVWLPVGGGGGKDDWELAKTRMQRMADGIEPSPWEM